jgi:predicted RecB family nuclease
MGHQFPMDMPAEPSPVAPEPLTVPTHAKIAATGEPLITGSMLYDLIACPNRVAMDLFADPADRVEVSPFVRMLWARGAAHERDIMGGIDVRVLDLSPFHGDEKERLTTEAMRRHEPLIYSGRIVAGDLVGEPDLLRWTGDGYLPGDIKSGAGEEGREDLSKPKVHYAVQLALYTDILEQKGLSPGRCPYIIDIDGAEYTYDLDAPYGQKNATTLWAKYQAVLAEARAIVARQTETLPAYGSTCKLCWWRTACIKVLEEADDLTLLPELGRCRRDAMLSHVGTITDFAGMNVDVFIIGKKTIFAGVGPDMLRKLHARAQLVTSPSPQPFLTSPMTLRHSQTEVFFDIDTDPMRDFCYLHGMLERRNGDNGSERFDAFFVADLSAAAERDAFAQAWAYLCARPTAIVYSYSKYERTVWRVLQRKYPDVCAAEEIEALFDPTRSVDLYYDVVQKATMWPTRDHSIKTLAKFLGFRWRDTDPSGAASIEWFDRWVTSDDPVIRQRIKDYNEDDCRATRVLLDGIRVLSQR